MKPVSTWSSWCCSRDHRPGRCGGCANDRHSGRRSWATNHHQIHRHFFVIQNVGGDAKRFQGTAWWEQVLDQPLRFSRACRLLRGHGRSAHHRRGTRCGRLHRRGACRPKLSFAKLSGRGSSPYWPSTRWIGSSSSSRLTGEEAYQSLQRVIENANAIRVTYENFLLGDCQVYPQKGTVAFSAHGSPTSPKMYASKSSCDEAKWLEKLWVESYYDLEQPGNGRARTPALPLAREGSCTFATTQ